MGILYWFAVYWILVSAHDGEVLHLARVSRLHMGAYLCIASNGIPPSVSKRFMLNVQCNSTFLSYRFNQCSFISLYTFVAICFTWSHFLDVNIQVLIQCTLFHNYYTTIPFFLHSFFNDFHFIIKFVDNLVEFQK